MHPSEWAAAAAGMNAIFGSIGTVALVVAGLAVAALVVIWRALRHTEGEHTETLVKIVGANTESHERNASAQRESSRAIGQLDDTMNRLSQSLRDTEEQRRHSLDLILQQRPAGFSARRRKGPPRG